MRVLLIAAPAALLLCACATIMRGTDQKFSIETSPPGAAITTSLGLSCPSTPCSFEKVSRKVNFTLTATKEGYKPATTIVSSAMSGEGGTMLFLGNLILGGLIGIVVDMSTSAANDLQPNPLNLILEPAAPAATPAG